MPRGGPRKILDVNAPKRERQKPGPKPKPKPDPTQVDPEKYVPPPRKRPKIRYTNEQIIEVLQFLYYHRILDKIPSGAQGERVARYRTGTILQKRPDLAQAPPGHRYRSPTYEEAADWFQIPKSTVSTWWTTKLEMIGIKNDPPPQAPMPDFLLRPSSTQATPSASGQPPSPSYQSPYPPPQGMPVGQAPPDPVQIQTHSPNGTPHPPHGMLNPQGVPNLQGPPPPQGAPDVPVVPKTEPAFDASRQPTPDPVLQLATAMTPSATPGGQSATPNPSEQLDNMAGDASNFSEEASNLDKEMVSSEEDGEEDDDEEIS